MFNDTSDDKEILTIDYEYAPEAIAVLSRQVGVIPVAPNLLSEVE